MIDAFNANGSSPPDDRIAVVRVPSMSEGLVEAYGRARARKWRWSARVKANGKSAQYRRRGLRHEGRCARRPDRVLAEHRAPRSTGTTPSAETITLGTALDRLLVEKARKETVAEYTRIANHLIATFAPTPTWPRSQQRTSPPIAPSACRSRPSAPAAS